MRYIILFIIAILLPVFAFLNFTQSEGEIKLASIFSSTPASDREPVVHEKTLLEEEKPDYKVPQIRYTEPTQFPLAALVSQPYLEGFRAPNFFPIRNWEVQIENVDAASTLVLEPVTQKALQHKSIFEP